MLRDSVLVEQMLEGSFVWVLPEKLIAAHLLPNHPDSCEFIPTDRARMRASFRDVLWSQESLSRFLREKGHE